MANLDAATSVAPERRPLISVAGPWIPSGWLACSRPARPPADCSRRSSRNCHEIATTTGRGGAERGKDVLLVSARESTAPMNSARRPATWSELAREASLARVLTLSLLTRGQRCRFACPSIVRTAAPPYAPPAKVPGRYPVAEANRRLCSLPCRLQGTDGMLRGVNSGGGVYFGRTCQP
jgi:hypothetical protein